MNIYGMSMLSKEELKQVLVEQREVILNKPLGIERSIITKIDNYKKLQHVIVFTGLRRVGKSTLLRQIISKHYSDSVFYYVNFEDERLFNFKAENFNTIYETLVELYGEKKTFFIDEIQNIKHFETFVRRFYDAGFKFYITGSNANLLSVEIGTKLTGRHLDIIVTPFSFMEYLNFNKVKLSNEMLYKTTSRGSLKKHFGNFLLSGGMPEYLIFNENEILTRIYNDIIIKDIAVRYRVSNLYEMKELFQYLISNFANRFSYTKTTKMIGLGSVNTTKNYLLFLSDTFFISIVNKFDFSMKKQIANEKKIYVIDNGFIPRISTKLTKDKGWLLENLVFNELKIESVVYYFSNKNYECDFVIEKEKKITNVIQVCWELTTENKERELKGLIEAMIFFDFSNGLILTQDQEEEILLNEKKIYVKPVWKWLLQKEQ
jgi:predicted AAA+ superfamily ATPase